MTYDIFKEIKKFNNFLSRFDLTKRIFRYQVLKEGFLSINVIFQCHLMMCYRRNLIV